MSRLKVLITIGILIISWLLFPFLTSGETGFLLVLPLIILAAQIVVSVLSSTKKLLFLALLNPVVFFAVYYTIKPTANYLNKTPTIMKCCYNKATAPAFDKVKSVYLDYYDDDCDRAGLYYYTLDINNSITNGLIGLFGNPISHKQVDSAKNDTNSKDPSLFTNSFHQKLQYADR